MNDTEEKLQQWVSGLVKLGQELDLSDDETGALIKQLPSAYLAQANKGKDEKLIRMVERQVELHNDPMKNREAISALRKEIQDFGKYLEE